MSLNATTLQLKPYPMERQKLMVRDLKQRGRKVYDFGVGDPKVHVPAAIRGILTQFNEPVTGYPSVLGNTSLEAAHRGYLERRLGQKFSSEDLMILPSSGSKEAIFHTTLCLVGRKDKKRHERRKIAYPVPGYPVYEPAIQFAGGIAVPMPLTEANDYLMEPWTLSADDIKDLAALWINYPHNPTAKTVDRAYLKKIIDWCHEEDVILLADDCYIDIYSSKISDPLAMPYSPLGFTQRGIISFMSLSKRSGLTGYRAGFMAGDPALLSPMVEARARFGVAQQAFVQNVAEAAWKDDAHVADRREIFTRRMEFLEKALSPLGLSSHPKEATFYQWLRLPDSYSRDDVDFALALAEATGIIVTPGRWLGSPDPRCFRMACVVEDTETLEAMDLMRQFFKRS